MYSFTVLNLSTSAIACAVTALICMGVGALVGLFAVVRQQIIFAMTTGICFLASGRYNIRIQHVASIYCNTEPSQVRYVPGLLGPEVCY